MNLNEFLKLKPPPGRVLFAKLWGSRSHNTQLPDSDYDFTGVYLLPTRQILGIRPPERNWTRDGDDKPDYAFYEAGRFCELLLKGNPGIVEMLYTEREYVSSPEWDELRSLRSQFLTQQTVKQYLGYMDGQLRKLEAAGGKKGLHTSGGAYNEKWAYHIVRLGQDARNIASGKYPVVWKETDSKEHELLMAIREGDARSWEEVRNVAKELVAEIEALKVEGEWALPAAADPHDLEQWLLKLRKRYWE